MKNKTSLLPVLIACGVIAACTPTQSTRGNIVEDFRMSEITPGISTRTNVLKSLGSPTTTAPFDDNTWYYIGQKMEKKGIFDPKVTDEKVVVVAFNDEGIVETLERIDSERIDIPKIRRKTKTGGNDITILEQVLGNVGRFNRPAGNAASTAGGTNN
jgi:outer membrane protein assembly factor BamE (lipoprotein component of BamABCDE complex)